MTFVAFIAMTTLATQANEEIKADPSITVEAPAGTLDVADMNETKQEEVK